MFLRTVTVIFLSTILLNYIYAETCPLIRKRSEWNADNGTVLELVTTPVEYAIVAHTVTKNCSCFATCASAVKNIQNFHLKQKRWNDIAYNFLIGGNGEIFEGVGFDRVGSHTRGYNQQSIGIAFIGDYTNVSPNAKQLEEFEKLLKCAVFIGALKHDYKLIGQCQVRSTLSPGTKLYNKIKLIDHWDPIWIRG